MKPEFSIKIEGDLQNGLLSTAHTISRLIQAEEHMVNIPPIVVHSYMNHGLAAWLSDGGVTIGGFIKAIPWHPNLAQVEGGLDAMEEVAIDNIDKNIPPTGFEVGSLLIPPEFRNQRHATVLVQTLAAQIRSQYSHLPVFAVVDLKNAPSNRLFDKLGWVVLNGVQQTLFHDKLGVDVLQGWEANILLHPGCLDLLQL